MGGAFSSAAEAVRATKNHVKRRCVSRDADAATGADWSALPEDLLLTVMEALDVPGLVRSGAVCTSWHDAYATFRRLRLPSPKQGPCLLYACDEYGPNDAALYCPSTNATFRVPFPGPAHHSRGFVASARGWVFATDEAGDPFLLNPITGAQAALPPVKTLPDMESFDEDGKHTHVLEEDGLARCENNLEKDAYHVKELEASIQKGDGRSSGEILQVPGGENQSTIAINTEFWKQLSERENLVDNSNSVERIPEELASLSSFLDQQMKAKKIF